VSPIYRLLEPLEVRAGVATPPERPGIGLAFDDEALAHYAAG
jgi:L-alanine-DL-glutamate epimerase-like enolase superfamily enzyme